MASSSVPPSPAASQVIVPIDGAQTPSGMPERVVSPEVLKLQGRNGELRAQLITQMQAALQRSNTLKEELELRLRNEDELRKVNAVYKRMADNLLTDVNAHKVLRSRQCDQADERRDEMCAHYDVVIKRQREHIAMWEEKLQTTQERLKQSQAQLGALQNAYNVSMRMPDAGSTVAERGPIPMAPLSADEDPTFLHLVSTAEHYASTRAVSGGARDSELRDTIRFLHEVAQASAIKLSMDSGMAGPAQSQLNLERAIVSHGGVHATRLAAERIQRSLKEDNGYAPALALYRRRQREEAMLRGQTGQDWNALGSVLHGMSQMMDDGVGLEDEDEEEEEEG